MSGVPLIIQQAQQKLGDRYKVKNDDELLNQFQIPFNP